MICLGDIAKHINGNLKGDASFTIEGIAPLKLAGPGHIAFVAASPKVIADNIKAGAVIIRKDAGDVFANRIEVDDPYWGFAKTTELFAEKYSLNSGIHSTVVVDPTAKIGENVSIGPFCVIGENAVIGSGSTIHANVIVEKRVCIGSHCLVYSNVTMRKNTVIGKRVIVHPGAVIGSEGFGFAEKDGIYTKIHQLGWVEIEDNVEIGANTCIDRGAIGPTVIRKGTKLDNLIHIAHNVEVGENTAMAAQVGISGSVKIGANVKIGGQAGLAGHLGVGDCAIIGAQAGVTKSVPADTMVSGYPARKHTKARKIEAILSSLPEWIKRIRLLEKGKPEK